MNPDGWWLVVTLVMATVGPDRPAIGPMTLEQCQTVSQAIEAEELPAVVEVACRRPRAFMVCPVPGAPWMGSTSACPVWDHRPIVGPTEDR